MATQNHLNRVYLGKKPMTQRNINRRFTRIFTDEDSDISPQRRRGRREKPEIRHRRSEIGRENGYFVCRERATNKNVSPSRTITGYLTADFRGFSQMGTSDDRLGRLRDRVFCLSGDDDKQKGSPRGVTPRWSLPVADVDNTPRGEPRGVDARTPQGRLFCPIAVSRSGKNSSLCDLCVSAVSKSFSAFIGVNLRLKTLNALRYALGALLFPSLRQSAVNFSLRFALCALLLQGLLPTAYCPLPTVPMSALIGVNLRLVCLLLTKRYFT